MSSLSAITIPNGTTYDLKDAAALRSAAAAPAFSSSAAYAEGDYVTHDGLLYRATAARVAGAWNSGSGFELVEIGTLLGDVETALETINGGSGGGGGGGGSTGYILTVNMKSDEASQSQGITVGSETFSIGLGGLSGLAVKSVALPIPASVTINYDGYASESGPAYLNGVAVSGNTVTIPQDRNSELTIRFATCLSPDTSILMADGSEKRLGDVKVGDEVMSVDPATGRHAPDTVSEVSSGVGKARTVWTFENGLEVETIGRHRFWNADLGEFMYLEAWNEGERAARRDGERVRLIGRRKYYDGVGYPHATLFTEKWNNYFANGLLAGNRRSAKGAF